jgi:hypothetical protein
MPRYLVERSFPDGLAIPEAIRRAAEANQLPVDRITEVRVLDPYLYP